MFYVCLGGMFYVCLGGMFYVCLGGMFYAVGVDSVTVIVLQVVMCTVYAMICLKASESSQMMVTLFFVIPIVI